jgi:hypothetical protein
MIMKALLNQLLAKLIGVAQSEPLVITGAIVSAIVYLAGHLGIILDAPSVTSVIAPLVVAVLGRLSVVPVTKVKALSEAK